MKKTFMILALVLFGTAAGAQQSFQDAVNPEMVHPSEHRSLNRMEIVIPQVNGYNVYKADLHTHTIYSDGSVLPKYRVMEAWQDGLDIMAVTEHVEYRPAEGDMVTYLEKYTDKKFKEAINHKLSGKAADKNGIMVDLNTAVKVSQQVAKGYGLTIIPGLEITRANEYGHFNALFTTDNNLVYDPDPYQSILKARAQGALIQHNHPGWRRETIKYTPWQEKVYGEGLIDGVEVVNGAEVYPGIVDRCNSNNLYISANTDIHAATSGSYRAYGEIRPMTLVFAKDKSLESVREALDARRTLAFGHGNVYGAEQLLKDLFTACVKVEQVTGSKYQITNLSSVPFVVEQPGKNRLHLDPMCSIQMNVAKGENSLKMQVVNMWSAANAHPTVEIVVK